MAKATSTPPPPYSLTPPTSQSSSLPTTTTPSMTQQTATTTSTPPVAPHNLTPQQIDDYNRLYRQVVRRTTRNSLGIATSSSLATVFPYMIGPAAASGYGLYKARKARHEIIDELEKRGFKVRKRDLVNGVAVGALQKLPLTFLLWGHDEIFFAASSLVETFPGEEFLLTGAVDAVNAHTEALDVPVLGELNGLAEIPVDAAHDLLGIDGAEERIAAENNGLEDTGGWHDSGAHVAQDVLLVAPVAAAVDRIGDYPFDRYDRRQVGSMSGGYPQEQQTPPPLPPRPKRG